MKSLQPLLQKVKSRIRVKSIPFIFSKIKDSGIFLIMSGFIYLWLPNSDFVKQTPTDSINFTNTAIFFIILACFFAMFMHFGAILRQLYSIVKMKWFKFDYLYLTLLDTHSFSEHLKLLPEESKELFETPLTEECLLHLMKSIEKSGFITHDDLQYVYEKMKTSSINEQDSLLIHKTKEFFEQHNIDVNTMTTVETLSVFKEKPLQHTQVINGKKDFKKML